MIFRIIYLLAAVCLMFSVDIFWDLPWVQYLSKGLLMPALIALILSKGKPDQISKLVIGALAFSWMGDMFLNQKDESPFFLFGLLSFLCAHVFYIVSFKKGRLENHEIPLTRKLPLLIFVFLAIGVGVFLSLRSELHQFELPVLFYLVVILFMVVQALNRFAKTNFKSFILVFVGAVFFMISDMVLAFDRFDKMIDCAPYIILSTYALAQWLIVEGMLLRD